MFFLRRLKLLCGTVMLCLRALAAIGYAHTMKAARVVPRLGPSIWPHDITRDRLDSKTRKGCIAGFPGGGLHPKFLASAAEAKLTHHTFTIAPGQHTGHLTEMVASRHPCAGETDAYERLPGDAMAGDATPLAREDYVEEAWRIVDPVLNAETAVHVYEPGSWGPMRSTRKLSLLAVGITPWPHPRNVISVKETKLAISNQTWKNLRYPDRAAL